MSKYCRTCFRHNDITMSQSLAKKILVYVYSYYSKHSNFHGHRYLCCLMHVCRTNIFQVNIWFHAKNFIFVCCKHSCRHSHTHRPSSVQLGYDSLTLDLTSIWLKGYSCTYNLVFVWLRIRVGEKLSLLRS